MWRNKNTNSSGGSQTGFLGALHPVLDHVSHHRFDAAKADTRNRSKASQTIFRRTFFSFANAWKEVTASRFRFRVHPPPLPRVGWSVGLSLSHIYHTHAHTHTHSFHPSCPHARTHSLSHFCFDFNKSTNNGNKKNLLPRSTPTVLDIFPFQRHKKIYSNRKNVGGVNRIRIRVAFFA